MEKPAVPAASDSELMLVMTRVFEAPAERVFDAWLDPAQIGKWIGPRTVRPEVTGLEAKKGGRYRITMHGPDGTGPTVGGIYRDIARPERLVFTWMWETGHPMGMAGQETLITLTFRALGRTKTEMTLRHEFLQSLETRDSHRHGWEASFEKLGEMLAGG